MEEWKKEINNLWLWNTIIAMCLGGWLVFITIMLLSY